MKNNLLFIKISKRRVVVVGVALLLLLMGFSHDGGSGGIGHHTKYYNLELLHNRFSGSVNTQYDQEILNNTLYYSAIYKTDPVLVLALMDEKSGLDIENIGGLSKKQFKKYGGRGVRNNFDNNIEATVKFVRYLTSATDGDYQQVIVGFLKGYRRINTTDKYQEEIESVWSRYCGMTGLSERVSSSHSKFKSYGLDNYLAIDYRDFRAVMKQAGVSKEMMTSILYYTAIHQLKIEEVLGYIDMTSGFDTTMIKNSRYGITGLSSQIFDLNQNLEIFTERFASRRQSSSKDPFVLYLLDTQQQKSRQTYSEFYEKFIDSSERYRTKLYDVWVEDVLSKHYDREEVVSHDTYKNVMMEMNSNKKMDEKTKEDIVKYSLYYADIYEINPILFYSLINVESRFIPNAVSGASAQGLTQLMRATFRMYFKDESKIQEIETNIECSTMLLKDLKISFRNNMKKTVAAYNAGPTAVRSGRYLQFSETRKYIPRIFNTMAKYEKNLFTPQVRLIAHSPEFVGDYGVELKSSSSSTTQPSTTYSSVSSPMMPSSHGLFNCT